jgi:hypothetical protein
VVQRRFAVAEFARIPTFRKASLSRSSAYGPDTGEIQIRFAKEDWSSYDESDDYSFDATKTDFAAWPRVTLYHKGTLIWGAEPGAK